MTGSTLDRLVHKADFERLLGSPIRSRSTHFAIHHLLAAPCRLPGAPQRAGDAKLSTGNVEFVGQLVDNFDGRRWLGTLVPKRHARRAVTRNLLKRQMRAAMSRHADQLPAGLWLVRLRAQFSKAQFCSAASVAMRAEAAGELERLITRSLP